MFGRRLNEHRLFRKAQDMEVVGGGQIEVPERTVTAIPKGGVKTSARAPTFASYEKRMDNLVAFWLRHMRDARSVEELDLWRTQMGRCSVILLEKARRVADPLKQHDLLEELYKNTAIRLVNECNTVYEKRHALLPKTTNVLQRAIWPSTGFSIAAMGVALSLLIPGAPVFDMIFGTAMLLYSARDVGKKTEDLALEIQTQQPLEAQTKAGFNWVNALAGLGVGIVGGLTLSGIGTPFSLFLISLAAFPPILVEAVSRVKDYYDTTTRTKAAKNAITQKQVELETLLDGKDADAIRKFLSTMPAQSNSQGRHQELSDVDRMFLKPANLVKELHGVKQSIVPAVEVLEETNHHVADIIPQKRS